MTNLSLLSELPAALGMTPRFAIGLFGCTSHVKATHVSRYRVYVMGAVSAGFSTRCLTLFGLAEELWPLVARFRSLGVADR